MTADERGVARLIGPHALKVKWRSTARSGMDGIQFREPAMTVSDLAHASAQELADTFGVSPRFVGCRNTDEGVQIDVAIADVGLDKKLASAGTVTLADHDLGFEGIRLQIVAAYPQSAVDFSRAVGTCALAAVEEGWPLRWGAVHPNVLTVYGLSETLAHFYFMPPFSWPDGPKPLSVAELQIEWLQAVPISEAERAFAEANGAEALEKLLVAADIDVTDLKRRSVA